MGHSYGTYLGTLASSEKPEYYKAYIGVGQMSDMKEAEYYSLLNCIDAAKEAGNKRDVKHLESLKEKVHSGKTICPRKYVRKYKFAEHEKSHGMSELVKGILFGPEYNLSEGFKMFYSALKYALPLAMQSVANPLPDLVPEVKVPTYFLLGKYDGMTNIKAAKEYFDKLKGDVRKEFIVFENSAHSPQIEENEAYVKWMCNDLLKENEL
ncbi:MAG: alpha/beta hydrolase, partial [Erysipelotrichaceae bacterium]|nr:alpha/beta hydrolase [Erysipelotrichaceae bacterium]